MLGWEDEAVKIRDDLEIDGEKLAEICERYGVEELWLSAEVPVQVQTLALSTPCLTLRGL